jgi:hypothetical protein
MTAGPGSDHLCIPKLYMSFSQGSLHYSIQREWLVKPPFRQNRAAYPPMIAVDDPHAWDLYSDATHRGWRFWLFMLDAPLLLILFPCAHFLLTLSKARGENSECASLVSIHTERTYHHPPQLPTVSCTVSNRCCCSVLLPVALSSYSSQRSHFSTFLQSFFQVSST